MNSLENNISQYYKFGLKSYFIQTKQTMININQAWSGSLLRPGWLSNSNNTKSHRFIQLHTIFQITFLILPLGNSSNCSFKITKLKKLTNIELI